MKMVATRYSGAALEQVMELLQSAAANVGHDDDYDIEERIEDAIAILENDGVRIHKQK